MNVDKIIKAIEDGKFSIKEIIAIDDAVDKKLNDRAKEIAMFFCKLTYDVDETKYESFNSGGLVFYGNDEFSEASVNFEIDGLDIYDTIEIPMDVFCGEYKDWATKKAAKELALLEEEENKAKEEASKQELEEYLRLKEKFENK